MLSNPVKSAQKTPISRHFQPGLHQVVSFSTGVLWCCSSEWCMAACHMLPKARRAATCRHHDPRRVPESFFPFFPRLIVDDKMITICMCIYICIYTVYIYIYSCIIYIYIYVYDIYVDYIYICIWYICRWYIYIYMYVYITYIYIYNM